MRFLLLLHPKAALFLRKADPQTQKRIKDSLRGLEESPREKGERLKHSSFWRLKIGDHRAIYEVDEEERRVVVLFIGHRKRVYNDFSRLL